MKKGIHPENYRLVAFKDMSNNDVFITKSAVDTKDTIKVEGAEYPLVKLEISRTSHPYYTGKSKLVDTAGRVDKFRSKYADQIGSGTALEYFAKLNRKELSDLLLKDGLFAASMAAHKVITTFDPFNSKGS